MSRVGRTDEFDAKKVLPSLDTFRDLEGHLALVCNEAVDAPLLTAVHAIFPDL